MKKGPHPIIFKSTKLRILPISAALFLSTVSFAPMPSTVPAALAKGEPSVTPSKVTLHGGISALATACAGSGISIEASTLPTTITKVRMGTAAAYAGVQEGDKLIDGSIGANHMQLLIERAGKRYSLSLRYTPDNLVKTRQNKKEQMRLAAEASKDSDWKTLKQYDIALLIDASGSMEGAVDRSGETKWQWCLEQIYAFAKEAQTLGRGAFDFCVFENQHRLKQNCTADEARQIMVSTRPGGGTDLSTPLEEILSDRLKKPQPRPLLIVIVSDGMPNSGIPVEQVVIATAKNVKILFLQIGNDDAGKVLANYLDNDLVAEGAPFDIVNSIGSDDLLDLGLRRGLIAAMNKSGSEFKESNPQIEAELAKVRAELARLRALNAGQTK
jgi:hypothetical protein